MKNSVITNVVADAQSFLPNVFFQKKVLENYTFHLAQLYASIESGREFIEEIMETYEADKFLFEISIYDQLMIIEEKTGLFLIEGKIENKDEYVIDIFTNTFEKGHELLTLFKKYKMEKSDVRIKMTTFSIDNKLVKGFKTIKMESLHEKKYFYPYLNTDEMFRQFTELNENILILVGAPGSGKTKMINLYLKYIMENPPKFLSDDEELFFEEDKEVPVAYVKSEQVIASDPFWSELQKNEYALIILDDLDNMLLPRTESAQDQTGALRNKFINHFLSYTDGIIKNNTKFIITTNRTAKEIDPAILRAGRAFEILELRRLTMPEAKSIWEKEGLNEKIFGTMVDEEHGSISCAELGSVIERLKGDETKGKLSKEYLLEDGISVLAKYKNKPKKIQIK